jgi:hypothetical protein
VASRYTAFALVTTNTLVLLVVLNLALCVPFALRDAAPPQPLLELHGFEKLRAAYPGWTEPDLRALLAEGGGPVEYEPFVQFRPGARSGRFVNVRPEGFRAGAGPRPWPPDAEATSVFFFGGSTAFGAGVPDASTIPAQLERALAERGCGARPAVYNFGRPDYFSSQERALFERLALEGTPPDLAVFFDGLNDFYHWRGVPAWTEGIRALVAHALDRGGVTSAAADLARRLPLGRAAAALGRAAGMSPGSRGLEGDAGGPPADDEPALRAVIDRWLGNKRLVEAVAAASGARALFAWQPVPTFEYDLAHHALYPGDMSYFRGHQRSRFGYARMRALRPGLGLGPEVLWLDEIQAGRRENLYVDGVHYTEAFSREIAERIAEHLRAHAFLRCAR